jgi:hypothetical protein
MKPMASLDPAAVAKILATLDANLAQRQTRRDAAQDAQWAADFDNDEVILFALRLARDFDRRKPGASVPLDRDAVERLESEIVELMDLAGHIELLERRREDEAAGIVRKCGKPAIRVKSAARLLPEAPKRNPSAPKPPERSGRRGEGLPPLVRPEEDGPFWQRGMVLSFNQRDWSGVIRGSDGREYPLESGCLMRSGLVSLIPGQRTEFLAIAGMVNQIRAAWHGMN